MAHTGRKPLAAGHVDHLQGSDRAKQRMKLMLECLQGARTVPEACRQLNIGESRFHAMRNHWLQECLQLLEPRPTGRPRKQPNLEQLRARIAELEKENRELRQQLREAHVRQEVAEITARPGQEAFKKTTQRRGHGGARRKPR